MPGDVTATREALAEAIKQRDKARDDLAALYGLEPKHPLQVEFNETRDALWKSWLAANNHKPRPFPPRGEQPNSRLVKKFLESPEFVAHLTLYQARGKIVSVDLRMKKDAAEKVVFDIAYELTPRPGPHPVRIRSASSYDFHTQGFGAEKYARGTVELAALGARALGLEVTVESDDPPPPPKYYRSDTPERRWAARAHVEDPAIDVEIILARPLALREWVRQCWKMGVNPRVYNPYLSVGYEEKVGLDYFGNDLKEKRDAAGK